MIVLSYFYSEQFEQALDSTIELLESSSLKPYDCFFSEHYLCDSLTLTSQVVQQVLSELINRGKLVYSSTQELLVAPPKLRRNMLKMASLSETMKSYHLHVTSRVITFEICEATKEAAQALNLPLGSEVLKLKRIRHTGALPNIIETSYLPAKTFSNLLNYDFNHHSLYDILEKEHGIKPSTQELEFITEVPIEDDFKYFHIGSKEPILVQIGRTSDQNGRIFEYSISRTLGKFSEFESSPRLEEE